MAELPAGTAFSVLTPPGDAAIAVIALEGKSAGNIVMGRVKRRAGGSDGLILADFLDIQGNTLDEVIVHVPGDAVRYVELHCHGGAAVTSAVVEQLKELGTVELNPREMLLRRHRAGGGAFSTIETEALLLLAEGLTPRAAGLVQGSVTMLSDAAKNGDLNTLKKLLDAAGPLERLCRTHCAAIAGAENSGKSTLANALGGGSLVTDIPGTTRDAVRRLVDWDGAAVEITDTAGLGEDGTPLHREAHKRALAAIAGADLVIWLTSPDTKEPDLPDEAKDKTIRVVNKHDLFPDTTGGLLISALTGEGVDKLRSLAVERLIGGEPKPGPFTRRQVEAIRKIISGEVALSTLLDDTLTG